MALTSYYEISYYTVYAKGVSAKVVHRVEDEEGNPLRTIAFRAEYLDDIKLQDRADKRGANATNKLSWHDADVEEEVKKWLLEKRYENPTNVAMIVKPEPEPEAP